MPSAFKRSSARMASVTVKPNFERYPPELFQRPDPRLASFNRMPIVGFTPIFSACFKISSSSVYFSTTGVMFRPIFRPIIASSMYSSSLKPLQRIGVSLSAIAITAINSGFDPASNPKWNGRPYSKTSSTTWRCWFTLIGNTHWYSPL